MTEKVISGLLVLTKLQNGGVMHEQNYLQSLCEFSEHLHASANQLIDDLVNGRDYNEKYIIQISVNGKSTTIELHADAYDRLLHMIN